MPLMLTKEERKKKKRLEKLEKERQKQDLIRFGLLPPPENRMKLSTFMKMATDEAIADPSAMEAKVRKQMADRQVKHEQHNQQRKLTPEQRKEKLRKKYREDTNLETHVALFIAGDLSDESRRLKIERNAFQMNVTGLAVLTFDLNFIIAEAGPKGLKKFHRVLTHRIDWRPTILVPEGKEEGEGGPDDDEEQNKPKNWKKCALVWQGVVTGSAFKNFRFEHARSEEAARKMLADKGVPHYFDLAKAHRDHHD